MKFGAILLAVCGLAAALFAAKLWYSSSVVKIPNFYTTSAGTYETDMEALIRQSATLNKRAAVWTAVASVLSALSGLAGSISF
jgi:hypothetical protein